MYTTLLESIRPYFFGKNLVDVNEARMQNDWEIIPLIKEINEVWINKINPIAKEWFICVNIILNNILNIIIKNLISREFFPPVNSVSWWQAQHCSEVVFSALVGFSL